MRKKHIREWIRALRLSVTIPAGLLVHVGFNIAHLRTDWLLVIELFFIATLAMVHNDYYDRRNDIKKGKRFAYDHPKEFLQFITIGWSVVWALAVTWLLEYWLMLMPVILISMFYSYTRKLMFLQTFCVAITSASPVLIGVINEPNIGLNISFFMVVFFAIFARELIKDTEDAKTDKGWKNTLVSSGMVDIDTFVGMAGALIERYALFPLMLIVSNLLEQGNMPSRIFLCLGLGLFFISTHIWFDRAKEQQRAVWHQREPRGNPEEIAHIGKKFFDASMFCIIIGGILF